MPPEDRLTVLCEQDPHTITGIDFVRVLDPATDQRELHVYFIVDPEDLEPPVDTFSAVPVTASQVSIESISGGERIARVEIESVSNATGADGRNVLSVRVKEPGDFSIYRLHIDDPRVDRFFNGLEFSFKQGCPSDLDCKPREECPDEPMVDFPVDYLARDFTSIRGALLDFAAQRYPDWTERIEADAGAMMAEVMAALGDELSYIQDRYAREAYLEALSQRRSMRWHTRLVDYRLHDGRSATTVLAVQALAAAFAEAGMRVWAIAGGASVMAFELGESIRDQREPRKFWIHPDWNAMPVHVPDQARPCLPVGSSELYLRGEFPVAAELPAPAPAPGEFWIGRTMVLESTPSDPSLPRRRHLVVISEVEATEDPLTLEGGAPVSITRIRWLDEQALPFEICLRDTVVHGNVVPATAGETFTEHFVIGSHPDTDVAPAVEREGPCNEITGERSATLFHSLAMTETRGLGWTGALREAEPEVELEEVEAATLEPVDPDNPERWQYQRSLLDSAAGASEFTLDDGIRRRVIGFRRLGEQIVHRDYASGSGFSIRFGDGEFAAVPSDGTVFRVRYRTGAGEDANLAADTVTLLGDPDPDPAVTWPTLEAIADSVTNPFPVVSGVDPEPLDVIRQLAPEAFRAEPLRAVRDEDYREIAERLLPWVQRAGAAARWTGSWLTEFATADPLGAFVLSDERRAELEDVLDCVRQVGREVHVRDPVFVNLDLQIKVCVAASAYAGQVQERVIEALTGPGGFFDPDNFTFGTPLKRAALEASIQSVPGVRGVEEMCLRARGFTPVIEFTAMTFEVADNRILRLQNDRRYPERGSLIVRTVTDVDCVGAGT